MCVCGVGSASEACFYGEANACFVHLYINTLNRCSVIKKKKEEKTPHHPCAHIEEHGLLQERSTACQ